MRMHNQWQADTYLHDIRVREAINLAINREQILKYIFQGLGKVTANEYPFGSWHLAYEPFPLYPYDPGRAKQLLIEAFPRGVTLTINSFVHAGLSAVPRVMEAISGMLGEVGIKTKIVPMDYSAHRAKWGRGELPNTLSGSGYSNTSLAVGGGLYAMWHSTGLLAHVKIAELDALIEAAMANVDVMDRARGEAQVARFKWENRLTVPLLEIDTPFAANPKKVTQWDLGKIPYDHNFLALTRQER